MRVLSLFSGGGLGDYGLELAGMEIIGQVEIDDYCQKILALRWPEVPKWTDIKEVHYWKNCPIHHGKDNSMCWNCIGVEGIDLISGGFPCQDISQAGKGVGITGARSGLWKEMLRIIREVRPSYVLVENVSALLGRGLGVVLGDLAESGYCVEWFSLSASELGAPHRRDRVWIVAHADSAGREEQRRAKSVFQKLNTSESNREMADSKIIGRERSRSSRNGRSGPPDRRSVCDATIQRLPDWAGGQVGQPSPLTEFERSSRAALDDTKSRGWTIRKPKNNRPTKGKKHSPTNSSPSHLRSEVREVERVICRIPHGSSPALVGLELSSDGETILIPVTNRVSRLKLLGNGQVVQVVQYIGERIMEFDK